jgi:hypothetical protein
MVSLPQLINVCQRRREHASARRSKNTSRAKAVSARQNSAFQFDQ